MRTLFVASLLLVAILPLPQAAALPYLQYDFSDPRDDVLYRVDDTAYEVPLPKMDVVRMTTGVVGEEVVQTLHFVDGSGLAGLKVEVSNYVTEGSAGQMYIVINYDEDGQPPATVDAELVVDDLVTVPVEVGLDGNALRLSFSTDALPADVACFHPSAILTWGEHHTEVVEVLPNTCDYGEVLTDGLNGSCPPAPDGATIAHSGRDPAGDTTGFNPETFAQEEKDEPGFDLVGFESRREGDRIEHVIRYADDLTNGSHLMNIHHSLGGAVVSLEYSTTFGGLLPDSATGEIDGKAFHVDFERGADTVTLSYCASVLPQDVSCAHTEVKLNAARLDFADGVDDSMSVGDESCGQDGGDGGTPVTPTANDGTDGAGSGGDGATPTPPGEEGANAGENDTPGAGVALVALALLGAALALRRR